MSAVLISVLSGMGALFLLIAGVGLLRMEDVYTRLHGASKAAPLGAVLILIALAIGSGSLEVTLRVVAVSVFLLLTAPIAAHVIGRAAYLSRERLQPAQRDQLRGKYDLETMRLHSSSAGEWGREEPQSIQTRPGSS